MSFRIRQYAAAQRDVSYALTGISERKHGEKDTDRQTNSCTDHEDVDIHSHDALPNDSKNRQTKSAEYSEERNRTTASPNPLEDQADTLYAFPSMISVEADHPQGTTDRLHRSVDVAARLRSSCRKEIQIPTRKKMMPMTVT